MELISNEEADVPEVFSLSPTSGHYIPIIAVRNDNPTSLKNLEIGLGLANQNSNLKTKWFEECYELLVD